LLTDELSTSTLSDGMKTCLKKCFPLFLNSANH